MRKIPYITLTGADDNTNPERLIELAETNGLDGFRPRNVEWGILYSTTQQGQGRYPSLPWIEGLAGRPITNLGPGFALHVCGRAVRDFIEGRGHVTEVAGAFDRVQLNFCADDYDISDIRACLLRNSHKTIITQHNATNSGLWEILGDMPNHAVLFDSSGGRGQSPANWPLPLIDVSCGYAGGLGPDNLSNELPRIQEASQGKSFWVDMEGKLRDENDRFDLERASRCLEIAGQYFHRQKPRLGTGAGTSIDVGRSETI